jgi:hypothetical protein
MVQQKLIGLPAAQRGATWRAPSPLSARDHDPTVSRRARSTASPRLRRSRRSTEASPRRRLSPNSSQGGKVGRRSDLAPCGAKENAEQGTQYGEGAPAAQAGASRLRDSRRPMSLRGAAEEPGTGCAP